MTGLPLSNIIPFKATAVTEDLDLPYRDYYEVIVKNFEARPESHIASPLESSV